MAIDKAGLLDAIAQAGKRGAEAYQSAQAQLAAQQQEAVRMALANGIASSAPQGAQDELSRIISTPYQNRAAQLTSNQATMSDYYNRLGAAGGQYMDQANALLPAIEALAAQNAAGGGGGGGGGSTDTWYDAFKDQYGTQALGIKAILAQAKMDAGPDDFAKGVARQRAIDMGVPEDVALGMFPMGRDEQWTQHGIQAAQRAAIRGVPLKKFNRKIAKQAGKQAGSQRRESKIVRRAYKKALGR